MKVGTTELRNLLMDSPVSPPLLEARALVVREVRRLQGSIRGRYNDAADALGLEPIAEPVAKSWRRILARGAPDRDPGAAPRVLIASGYGFSDLKLALETVFGVALQMRGAWPIALACDAAMASCEMNSLGNHEPSPAPFGPQLPPRAARAACTRCTVPLQAAFEEAGIEQLGMANFVRPDDLGRLSREVDSVAYEDYRGHVYRGVGVGQHAFSSVLRATLRGTPEDDPKTRWLYRRYLVTAMHVVDLAERVFAATRPDRLVAVHGVYVTHGTLCEVARRDGIPVSVFGVPYRQGTVWLSHGDSYHRTLVTESHAAWEDTPLSDAENRVLDEYLNSRRGGGRDYVNFHPHPIEDAERIQRELGLDSSKPIVSLYTNVLWDAQIFYDYNAFPNMLDWLYSSIEYLGKRSDVQLVVRVHPAEVKGGFQSNQLIVPELQARFAKLPANVRVVPPESDISSYTLAEMSTAALIYGTKMGLEIAIRGVPVVVAGETFNRGKGFTHDASSVEHYYELLDQIAHLPRNTSEMVERARRYAYYFFFRRMMDFDLVKVADAHSSRGLRFKFDSIEALAPGRNRTLDIICSGILDGSPFQL